MQGSDNAIPAEARRFMAERAKSKTMRIKDSSHVAMISRPDATTGLNVSAYLAPR